MPPSKGKKSSRPTQSPSPSVRSPLPRTPSTPSAAGRDEEGQQLRSLLSEASAKFPDLISESAFIGRVSGWDASSRYKGGEAVVWLSEEAAASSSLKPGSLVSVSLASPGNAYSDGLPLAEFSDGCPRYFGNDYVGSRFAKLGNFFAIARPFISPKVLKNEVKLSWCLSLTMGFPANGRAIFIYPMGGHSTQLSESEKLKSYDIQFSSCTDLHLRLVPVNANKMLSSESTYPVALGEKINKLSASGNVSSPKTPSGYQPKLSSPSASPSLSNDERRSKSVENVELNLTAISLALEDQKLKDVLKIFAARWLTGRYLLVGNFLSLPISEEFIFLVEDANTLPGVCSSHNVTYERNNVSINHSVSVAHQTQIYNLSEQNIAVFVVDYRTKVFISKSVSEVDVSDDENMLLEKSPTSKLNKNSEKQTRLGGLSKEFAMLKEIITFSLMHKSSLLRYKGVLLHGPPGTGKTSLASACAHSTGANFFAINGPEVVSQYYGESEQALQDIFESARRAAPAVVFIDELDAIAPARKEGGEELSLRMVATLLTLMDGIHENDGVLVIAATNRPDSIDPALRRPGRLDKEIEIGVPSPDQRLEILNTILDNMYHSVNEKDIQSLAWATHGFVGADLAALCNEAAMIALRRYTEFDMSKKLMLNVTNENPSSLQDEFPVNVQAFHGDIEKCVMAHLDSVSLSLSELSLSSTASSSSNEKVPGTGNNIHSLSIPGADDTGEVPLLQVTTDDFEKAKLKVRPSAMREVMLEFPKVNWDDVGGQAEVKRQLIEAVQWPQMCPDAFKRIGIRPPRGLLMFGPPGCSKTLMARAVASEAKLNFLAVKGPELFSKWVGDSEKAVKSLFAKARANSPSIIFFDEIDGLAITRGQDHDGTSVGDRVLSQLLVELDGLNQRSGIVVIAATNRPDKIDPALLRPGRFDRHLDVKPPSESDRDSIFGIHMRGMPCGSDVTARDLAGLTEGYTGADIKLICREAAIAALEESFEVSEISMRHFKIGIGRVQPSELQFYQTISEKFKRYVDSGHSRDQ